MPEQTHNKCKYFGFRQCIKLDDDIMQRANQLVPEYHGGKIQEMLPLPSEKEINDLCTDCEKFTLK